MFKGNKKYIFILAACFSVLIVIQLITPKPIDWKLSYMQKDKIPFGTSALYDLLADLFPGQEIRTEKYPIYNALVDTEPVHSNYIIINETFESDDLDARELLEYAHRGNTVFIAANYFSGKFADTLKLKTDNFFDLGNTFSNDSAALVSVYKPQDSVSINFVNPYLKKGNGYSFTKGFENSFFTSFDTSRITVLGTNSKNEINFIRLKWGTGQFLLCTVPEAFSNYHFVNEVNKDYTYAALSYLPIQDVIWDEHYKAGNVKSDSPLKVIFDQPALRTAYFLLLISILLFMLIGIKRRQRIIPVLEPFRNTTLQFVDVVGTLYYQTGDHKNIADKKITYFLEYIRSTFQVKTTLYDDVFIDRISNLSGIERHKVHVLFYYFADLSVKTTITQQELLKLNKMIEEFHKYNKR